MSSNKPMGDAPIRAVQYVRMSTDHQQYSTENQSDVIQEYAAKHGITIVKTYTDAGKSGLRIDGRESLQQLIRDVTTGKVDFDCILVYDIGRWGRFPMKNYAQNCASLPSTGASSPASLSTNQRPCRPAPATAADSGV